MSELEKAKQGIKSLIAIAENKATQARQEMELRNAEAFSLRSALHEIEKAQEKPKPDEPISMPMPEARER